MGLLYEWALGVPRDREAAYNLYKGAEGGVFDGPAQLGLLRLAFVDLWDEEKNKWMRWLSDADRENIANDTTITVKSKRQFLRVEVLDAQGRRVFAGSLQRGQEYIVPASRNDLTLWLPYGGSDGDVEIRVGPKIIDLPKPTTSSERPIDRILLNADRLLTGDKFWFADSYDRPYPKGLPPEGLLNSRIEITAVSNSNIYIHSNDQVIGFEESDFYSSSEFKVPNIVGQDELKLELRPSISYASGEPQEEESKVNLSVGGTFALALSAPPGCFLEVELQPEKLLHARAPTGLPTSCASWDVNAIQPAVVDTSGNAIGYIRKLPSEDILYSPKGGMHLNTGIALLALRISGQWDEAYRTTKIAVSWDLRSNGPNSFETIRDEIALSDLEAALGHLDAARTRLDGLVDRLKKIGGIPAESRADLYVSFGFLLHRLGRAAQAERFLVLGLGLHAREGDFERHPMALRYRGVLDELSEISEELGRTDKALMLALQSDYLTQLSNPQRSDAFVSEQPSKVRVLDLLRKTGRSKEYQRLLPFMLRQWRRELGVTASGVGLPLSIDLSVFERSFGRVDYSETLAGTMATLGSLYAGMGRHDIALRLFQQYADTRQKLYGRASPEAAAAVAKVAEEYGAVGSTSVAVEVAQRSFSTGEQHLAAHTLSANAAASLMTPLAQTLLNSLYQRESSTRPVLEESGEQAFEVAQAMQSSAAALALEAFGRRLSQSEPELRELIRRRQDIQEELSRFDVELIKTMSSNSQFGDPSAQKEIRNEIQAATRQLAELDRGRSNKVTGLDDLTRNPIVSYRAIRGVIRRDEVLVSIYVGEERTFVFAATRERLRWARIDLASGVIDRMVETLRCGLDRQRWFGQAGTRRCTGLTGSSPRLGLLPFDAQVAYDLFQALFGPIQDTLTQKRLLLVFSGSLTSLPPEVLVTEPPQGGMRMDPNGYRNLSWFGRKQSITILPSVSTLVSLRKAALHTRAALPYIGLGDPKLRGNPACVVPKVNAGCPSPTGRGEPNSTIAMSNRPASPTLLRGDRVDVEALSELCPLPDTARELGCVASSIGKKSSRLLLGTGMTEAAVKKISLDQFQIVHFATHGLLADEVQRLAGADAEPALVLTPPKQASSEDDGLLMASEISKLKLNADWVVLSACNTAGGEGVGADALSGLARAFFYAGARTLLVSHWEVNSSAAVFLTTRAFAELKRHPRIGPSEALRRSVIKLIDDKNNPRFAHPEYWAPFVVIGEGAAILE